MSTNARLTVGEKVAYALGDTACGMYWRLFEVFLLAFYTDVFGLSPAAAGTLFLVSRVWDAINDPAMGAIADRTHTRFGRYRPWVAGMALPLALCGVLMFTTPDWSDSAKTIYAYVTYILMMTAYTAVNIPYSALLGVLSPDSAERTSVSSFRFVGAFTGGFVVLFATPLLVAALGGDDDNPQQGWTLTLALYGVAVVVMLLATAAFTRERADDTQHDNEPAPSFFTEARGALANDAMVPIVVLGVLVLAGLAIRGSATLFYLRYVVGPVELQAFGTDFGSIDALTSAFLTVGGLASLVGVLLTDPLSRQFGKMRVYVASMVSTGVLWLGFLFLPGEELEIIFVLHVLSSFTMGPSAPILFAMFADVADYGEWRSGRRSTGLVFAGAVFGTKFGAAMGGFASGALLAAFGYVANQPQDDFAQLGIILLVSVVPAVSMLAGVAALRFYPLGDARVQAISEDLAARRDAA